MCRAPQEPSPLLDAVSSNEIEGIPSERAGWAYFLVNSYHGAAGVEGRANTGIGSRVERYREFGLRRLSANVLASRRRIGPSVASTCFGTLVLTAVLVVPGFGAIATHSFQAYDAPSVWPGSSIASTISPGAVPIQPSTSGLAPVGRIATLPVGGDPIAAVYDDANGYVYIVNHDSDTVSALSDTALVSTIAVGSGPLSATYDSGNGLVYVTNSADNSVSIINGVTVVATVTVGFMPWSGVYDSGNGYVYITNEGSGSVSVFSGTSLIGTLGVGVQPIAVTYDIGNGWVYVANANLGKPSTVSIINGLSLLARVAVGAWPVGGTCNDGSGYVYVTNQNSGDVTVIGGTTNDATIPTGFYPLSATYDGGNGYVYVSNEHSATESVINGAQIAATIPVGVSPQGAVYDRNDGYVYVANFNGGGTGSVSVIGGTSVVTTVPVGSGPAAEVYDSRNAYVYVANQESDNVTIVGPGPTYDLTFTESNLPSGTEWSVTLGDITDTSANGTIVFTGMADGNYIYTVGPAGEYTSNPSSGTLTVFGKSVAQSVTFGTTVATASSSGPPLWTYVGIGLAIVGAAVGIAVVLIRHRRPPRTPTSTLPPLPTRPKRK